MVDAIVSFAIEKLGEFIAQEVNIRKGVKYGVRWLKDELGYLHAVVRDAELRQEELIRNWVNNIRDVSNDAVVGDLRWNGKVKNCQVHDLVRDLAINKAKEQKLLVVFDSGKHHADPLHLLGQPRHVIYNGISEYLKLLERRFDASCLCSLALVKYSSAKVELKEMKLIYTKFKNLKVLDMRSVDSERVPEEIGNLVIEDPRPTLGSFSNLTFLELYVVYAGNKIVCSHNAFPSLQFLKLDGFFEMEELEVEDGAFPSLKQFQALSCDELKKIPVQLERFWVPNF